MRFLFGTDLHGDQAKYEYLVKIANQEKVDAIVIGGDIAPKHEPSYTIQKNFYNWLAKLADSQDIPVYAFLGNDDLKCLLLEFIDICNCSKNLKYLKARGGDIKGITYLTYNWVPDYPFGLKDWCKRDNDNFVRPKYLGQAVLSKPGGGYKRIPDVKKHFDDMSTIERDLRSQYGANIAFMHAPPAWADLDVCANGFRAGSNAIRDWIERESPILSLHGHIHESPRMTGVWKTKIGSTVSVQPGDRDFCIIDIDPATGVLEVKRANYK